METRQGLSREAKSEDFDSERNINHTLPSNDAGFRERYSWIFKNASLNSTEGSIINIAELASPLGPMLAGATAEGVCLLEFSNRIRLEREFIDLQKSLDAVMLPGRNQYLDQLENELREYFEGKRKIFSVPLDTPGNEFAQTVWKTIQQIPYGKTCSYKQQAEMMNNPKAIRAIASTNGRNRLAIIIPCHRIIGSDGSMTGYAAGIEKKKWLLKFEKEHSEIEDGYLF